MPKTRRPLIAAAAAGLLVAGCAHSDSLFSDPLFWEGVGLAADLAVVAIVLDDTHGCRTRVDHRGRPYSVCGHPPHHGGRHGGRHGPRR